jgi:hypothetical protein
MAGGIIPLWRATSSRNRGRLRQESAHRPFWSAVILKIWTFSMPDALFKSDKTSLVITADRASGKMRMIR